MALFVKKRIKTQIKSQMNPLPATQHIRGGGSSFQLVIFQLAIDIKPMVAMVVNQNMPTKYYSTIDIDK